MTDTAAVPLTAEEEIIVAGLDSIVRPVAIELRNRAIARGVPFRFREGRRDIERQKRLFETLPKGQAAAPGSSQHEIGTAFDIVGPSTDAQWDIVGAEGEALGLVWGGRFKALREPWHFQAPLSRQQLVFIQTVRALAFGAAVAGAVAIYNKVK